MEISFSRWFAALTIHETCIKADGSVCRLVAFTGGAVKKSNDFTVERSLKGAMIQPFSRFDLLYTEKS